ncbi:transcriptional regulator, DeoR family [Clostridiales bacterium oral taxon 876 str. F0540]|nr:transcriptional regulator, DeoR family [Clostridiales bacterium oral taxon 876 str. F0540]
MFTEERIEQILDMLNKHGRVRVNELSKLFKVSEGMIRKDLQRLEKEGTIKRTYGGAILNREISKSSPITSRMNVNLSNKEIIAKKAFDLIKDGDVVFLEASSINLILARLIAESTKKITLITNMILIPPLFKDNEISQIICIGGVYDNKSGGVMGSEVFKSISNYIFNKGFLGSAGVNLITGSVGTASLEDGNVKELVVLNSKEVFLLIEKEKFNLDSTYRFSVLEDFDAVITDSDISNEVNDKLTKLNVKLL